MKGSRLSPAGDSAHVEDFLRKEEPKSLSTYIHIIYTYPEEQRPYRKKLNSTEQIRYAQYKLATFRIDKLSNQMRRGCERSEGKLCRRSNVHIICMYGN